MLMLYAKSMRFRLLIADLAFLQTHSIALIKFWVSYPMLSIQNFDSLVRISHIIATHGMFQVIFN